MISAFLTGRELFGHFEPLDNILKSLQEYQGEDLLFFASKLNLHFYMDRGITNKALHDLLAGDFLDEKSYKRYLKKQEEQLREHQNELSQNYFRPLIAPTSILFFIKHVMLHHKFKGLRVLDYDLDPKSGPNIFSLILHLNYHINQQKWTQGQLFADLVKNAFFHFQEYPRRVIGRYYHIIFEILKNDKVVSEKTIQELFSEHYHVSLTNYLAAGMGILSKFVPATRINYEKNKSDPYSHYMLNWDVFFSTTAINEVEKQHLKKLYCIDLEQAKIDFVQMNHESLSFQYSISPFLHQPLLNLRHDITMLPFFPYLVNKFTYGIFYMINDKLSESDKGQFRDVWGNACQIYVSRLFKDHILPKAHILDDDDYSDLEYVKNQSSEARASDMMFFDRSTKTMWLFEVTFSSLTMPTLTKIDNQQEFITDSKKMILNKLEQIKKVIDDIENGVIPLNNILQTEIEFYRPILIFMQPYPLMPCIWHGIDTWPGIYKLIELSGCVENKKVKSPRILHVGEIEILASMNNIDPLALVSSWSDREFMNEHPFSHCLYTDGQFPKEEVIMKDFNQAWEVTIQALDIKNT